MWLRSVTDQSHPWQNQSSKECGVIDPRIQAPMYASFLTLAFDDTYLEV
jgi:hypothetical protein